jgi:hypothetical protein
MLDSRMNHAEEKWRNVTAWAFVTFPQILAGALRDRASHLDHLAHNPFQSGRISSRPGHFFGFAFFTADFLAPFFALPFPLPRSALAAR